MFSYFSHLVRIFSGPSRIAIESNECFVSRTRSNKLTSYEKPVGRPRGRNVVCQKDPIVILSIVQVSRDVC